MPWVRKGIAHSPPKAKKLPEIPALTQAAGQVARFFTTRNRPVRITVLSKVGAGVTALPGSPCGRSRTSSQASAPSASETMPTPMNTPLQPVDCAIHDSGEPASTEPKLPTSIDRPTTLAKRCSSNQTAMIFSMAMKVTDTPNPINVRPASAPSRVVAMPNSRLPPPAIMPPKNRMRRGPSVSTRMPVGTCISV